MRKKMSAAVDWMGRARLQGLRESGMFVETTELLLQMSACAEPRATISPTYVNVFALADSC